MDGVVPLKVPRMDEMDTAELRCVAALLAHLDQIPFPSRLRVAAFVVGALGVTYLRAITEAADEQTN